MPKRAVFDVEDSQLERYDAIGLSHKKLSSYASDAFEEWLKRREGRARRARLQIRKYEEVYK
jgi:hypothetical protein